ncbi:HD-GYP domain-containing protein [Desulfosporosinus acidiphilus]|uniref:HD-GYP domain-containing protein n=1 Tax=Desulfosporosinus acidiphilus TaxID=885581 RepID=UPI0002F47B25|nr:HD-GYP domain-containing protein [Desulfosporosinus acidiphilus]
MNWLLKPAQLNLTVGMPASADLFDKAGVLLLHKGQPVTEGIGDLLRKRKVYIWDKQEDDEYPSRNSGKPFPKDVYEGLVGSLWNIFHEAKLITAEQIEKTIVLVETIVEQLKPLNVYLNLDVVPLDLEQFRNYDYGTFVHSLNVAILATMTGMRLRYPETKLKHLTLGALLHDLGKLNIPKEILNKPGNLTENELAIMRRHPQLGAEMLENCNLLTSIMDTVIKHHERWNGTGYPFGLNKQKIHLDAQIVAVTDVFEALTADRPYRKGLPPYYALEMIIAGADKAYNPQVVKAFRESLILYPENSVVTLNTGEIGVVAAVPMQMPTRPLVRLLLDNKGRTINKTQYVDLMQDLTRFIGRVEYDFPMRGCPECWDPNKGKWKN